MDIKFRELSLKINDKIYSSKELSRAEGEKHSLLFYDSKDIEHLKNIALFLENFFDENETIDLFTSGSTSKAKRIVVRKKDLLISAKRTIDYFNLKKNDKILLCLPSKYIGGQMMIIRALVASLSLYAVNPALCPLREASKYSDHFFFVAMTAMQVANILENEEERALFIRCKKIIIGGSAIEKSLEDKIQYLDNEIYSSYAMTETLSHIAMRRLNGTNRSKYYKTMEGVSISKSKRNTLVLSIKEQGIESLETNDIVEFDELGNFRVLGRTDNVINTGAIKVQIEELESKLFAKLGIELVITSRKSELLGQEIVLLIEVKYRNMSSEISNAILDLNKYERPKSVLYIEKLPKTENSKIDRKLSREIAESYNMQNS